MPRNFDYLAMKNDSLFDIKIVLKNTARHMQICLLLFMVLLAEKNNCAAHLLRSYKRAVKVTWHIRLDTDTMQSLDSKSIFELN